MRKMAIISSTNYQDWPMGGMLSFLRDIIPHLAEYFKIDLWGVKTRKEEPGEIHIGRKVFRLHYFGKVNKSKRKIIPNLLRVIWKISWSKVRILSQNYDVLYFHGIPLELAFLKNKRRKAKIISHIHGVGNNPFLFLGPKFLRKTLASYYERYRKFVIESSDLTIISSDSRRYSEFVNELPSPLRLKTTRIIPFANPELFHPLPQDSVRRKLDLPLEREIIVTVMRLVPEKDPFLLIDIYKEIEKISANPPLIFVFGEGSLRKKLENAIDKEGLQSKIYIKGFVPREKLKEWLNAADLFLFTSSGEGLPLSLTEALLCGLPIVTPDIPGVHDIVKNGHTGYIVGSRDPKEIALTLKEAFKNSKFMRKKCLEKAREFTPQRAAEIISEEIEKLWT